MVTKTTEPAKIGFGLIHGGGFGPWVWERVTPLLTRPVLALERVDPTRPNLNIRKLCLADCAAFAQTQIEQADFEKIILVAHSGGGILAPAIAALLPQKIVHIIFVAANIPPEGKAAIDILPFKDWLMNKIAVFLQGYGFSMPQKQLEHAIRNIFCHDVDEAGIQLVLSHGVTAEPPALAFKPVSRAAMPTVPCTYIKLLQDRTISIENQDQMVANLGGANVVTLDSGHVVMLSCPQELAGILNQIAKDVTTP